MNGTYRFNGKFCVKFELHTVITVALGVWWLQPKSDWKLPAEQFR